MVNFGEARSFTISPEGHLTMKRITELSNFNDGKKVFQRLDIYFAAAAWGIANRSDGKVTKIRGKGYDISQIDPNGLFQLVLENLHPEIQDDVAELKKAFEEYAEAGLKHFSEVVHSEVDLLDLMMPETSKKSREEQLTANLRRSIDELLEE
ncbi:MAG: hypothetical protein QF682_01825 [Candidatus Thermoplasmatota archaeon]|nr:hypothetical protein [Candidatus Thermoplasmatota archaeon]